METIYDKLILEFMGYKNISPDDKDFDFYSKNTFPEIELREAKYSKSWDWLMPVVEKINTMDNYAYSVNIKYHYTDIVDSNGEIIITEDGYNTIDGVYKAVISFIKWRNSGR